MKTLVTKGLVVRSNRPAKYGFPLACVLSNYVHSTNVLLKWILLV